MYAFFIENSNNKNQKKKKKKTTRKKQQQQKLTQFGRIHNNKKRRVRSFYNYIQREMTAGT